jgi:hypothetical protein
LAGDLPSLKHKAILRYEDFVAEPQSHVDWLCDWLDLPRFQVEELVVDKSPAYFASISEEDKREVAEFCCAHPGMVEFFSSFGYSMTAPFNLGDPQSVWPLISV